MEGPDDDVETQFIGTDRRSRRRNDEPRSNRARIERISWQLGLPVLLAILALAGWLAVAVRRDRVADPPTQPTVESAAPFVAPIPTARTQPPRVNIDPLPAARTAVTPVVVITLTSSVRPAEPVIHIISDGRVRQRTLPTPVWLAPPSYEWPGDTVSPFIEVAGHLVYPSNGAIWSQELTLVDSPARLISGVALFAADDDQTVWVIGSGGRTITSVDVVTGAAGRPRSADELGFPRAAFSSGLVVDPAISADIEGLALWRPNEPLEALPVDPNLDLLGVANDKAVFSDGRSLTTYDITTRATATAALDAERQIRHAALSQDGSLVALSQRPNIVSYSSLEIYDTRTGALVDTIDPVVEWQFEWSTNSTLLAIVPSDTTGLWELAEHRVGEPGAVAVAGIDSPIVLLASQAGVRS